MSGLSTVATALTVVFVVSLAILIGDLLYVLWRRRRFLQRSVAGGVTEIPGDPIYTPSKELLYFFCWKNQSRVEPATAVAPPPIMPEEEEEEEDDLAKWQVYGPSRVLFTIKEEEKEELESENSLSEEKRVCLKDRFEAVVVEVDEATPFSTPCESPLYYTPSPSPSHDQDTESESESESERVHGGDHSLETTGFSENEASFVTIQIHGN